MRSTSLSRSSNRQRAYGSFLALVTSRRTFEIIPATLHGRARPQELIQAMRRKKIPARFGSARADIPTNKSRAPPFRRTTVHRSDQPTRESGSLRPSLRLAVLPRAVAQPISCQPNKESCPLCASSRIFEDHAMTPSSPKRLRARRRLAAAHRQKQIERAGFNQGFETPCGWPAEIDALETSSKDKKSPPALRAARRSRSTAPVPTFFTASKPKGCTTSPHPPAGHPLPPGERAGVRQRPPQSKIH